MILKYIKRHISSHRSQVSTPKLLLDFHRTLHINRHTSCLGSTIATMQLRPTQLYASPLASYWKPRVTLMVTPAKVETVQPHEHKAKLSHEVISGAVAYEVWPRLFFID